MEPRKAHGGPNGVAELMWWMGEVGRLVDDPEALAQADEIRAELDRQIRAAARRLNGEGFSWGVIGRALGVSDVNARKRFLRTGGSISSRRAA